MHGNYIILFIADKCGENAINRSRVNKSRGGGLRWRVTRPSLETQKKNCSTVAIKKKSFHFKRHFPLKPFAKF